MKSTKLLTFIGIFVIITSLICFTGKNEVYKKKIHYNSPEEVINVLNTKTLSAYKENQEYYHNLVNTDDFKECLSKRKRTVGSNMRFKTLNLSIQSDFDEESIKEDYLNCINHFNNYKHGDNIKAYFLKGTYMEDDNAGGNIDMYLVFVDEGEGYVIDYARYVKYGDGNYYITE